MSDALPLPSRPNLDHYRKVAKDLQHACRSQKPDAVRDWAKRLVETESEVHAIERRWRDFTQKREEQLESGFRYAAGYGHPEVVRFLLEKGVDAGVRDDGDQNALHWTTYGPHLEIARMLIAADAAREVQRADSIAFPLRPR